MNQLFEYTTHHPFLVGAAAILAVLTAVIEVRQRARGSTQITPNDAVRLINSGALLLDVRDTKDYEAGHIADARSVPAAEIVQRAEGLKKHKEKPVLVYCEGGYVSSAAAKALRAQGFSKVATLRGGLHSWRQENLPLIKGAAKKESKA